MSDNQPQVGTMVRRCEVFASPHRCPHEHFDCCSKCGTTLPRIGSEVQYDACPNCVPQPTPAEPRIEPVPIERRCSCPPWRGHDDDPCEFCQEQERARVEAGAQPEPEEREEFEPDESAACWAAFEEAPDVSAMESDYTVFEQGWNAAKAWQARARAGSSLSPDEKAALLEAKSHSDNFHGVPFDDGFHCGWKARSMPPDWGKWQNLLTAGERFLAHANSKTDWRNRKFSLRKAVQELRASPPSSPGAAPTDDDFTLSKNSLAREFFDCGYDGCTASQKVLIDSRYAQLTRASSPGAPRPSKCPTCARGWNAFISDGTPACYDPWHRSPGADTEQK